MRNGYSRRSDPNSPENCLGELLFRKNALRSIFADYGKPNVACAHAEFKVAHYPLNGSRDLPPSFSR
jgi:hypothetical protein